MMTPGEEIARDVYDGDLEAALAKRIDDEIDAAYKRGVESGDPDYAKFAKKHENLLLSEAFSLAVEEAKAEERDRIVRTMQKEIKDKGWFDDGSTIEVIGVETVLQILDKLKRDALLD